MSRANENESQGPPTVNLEAKPVSGSGRMIASPYTKDEEYELRRKYGKSTYLEALAETGAPFMASRVTGIRQAVVREWMKGDPEFANAVEEVSELQIEKAEHELYKRAVEGWEEPTGWYRGEPGGYVRKFSDSNLQFYLKAARPEVYRENVNISGGMMQGHVDLSKLSNEQLDRIRAGESALAVLGMETVKGLKAADEATQEAETDE